jgi:hypothetical protein
VTFRYLYFDNNTIINNHSLSVISDFAAGAIGAILSLKSKSFVEKLAMLKKEWIAFFYVVESRSNTTILNVLNFSSLKEV